MDQNAAAMAEFERAMARHQVAVFNVAYAVDLPGNGGPGGLGAFLVVAYADGADGRRTAVQGDTYVAAIEFSTPVRAQALIGYGNASQPGSPHRTDQLELFARKELRPVWRTRAEIMANLGERETLPGTR